jgi:hypothetical protein
MTLISTEKLEIELGFCNYYGIKINHIIVANYKSVIILFMGLRIIYSRPIDRRNVSIFKPN